MNKIEMKLSEGVESLLTLLDDNKRQNIKILAGISERRAFWGIKRESCYAVQMANGTWWSEGVGKFGSTQVSLLRHMTSWAKDGWTTCIGLWERKRCIMLHTHNGYEWKSRDTAEHFQVGDRRSILQTSEMDRFSSDVFGNLALGNLMVALSFDAAIMDLGKETKASEAVMADEMEAIEAAIEEEEIQAETDNSDDHHDDMLDSSIEDTND